MGSCVSWTYLTVLVALSCLGQVAPQDNCTLEGSSKAVECCLCLGTNNMHWCNDSCPEGYSEDTQANLTECLAPETTTAEPITTTAEPITTTAETTTTTAETTTTTNTIIVTDITAESTTSAVHTQVSNVPTIAPTTTRTRRACWKCSSLCASCSQTDDCISCKSGYTKTTSSTKCVENGSKSDNNKSAVIAGATVGGVAAVAIVVVIVVCYCRRRARSTGGGITHRGESEEGPSGVTCGSSTDLVSQGDTAYVRNKQHKGDYQNAPRKQLTVSTIQQGHDKVTRYTPDPTLKKAGTLSNPREERELEELGPAPPPPGTRSSFDDSESRSDHSARRTQLPLPALPGENRSRLGQQGSRTAARSGHTSAPRKPYGGKGEEVKEEDDPEAAYQNLTQQTRAQSGTSGSLRPVEKAANDDEDDDSPDESYENVGAKANLTEKKPKGVKRLGGHVNQAAKVGDDEEPQETYGNHEAIAEHKGQTMPHCGTPTYMPMDLVKTNVPADDADDDLPIYGNDADENLYVNVAFDPKAGKKS